MVNDHNALLKQVEQRQAGLSRWLNAPLSGEEGDTFDFSGVSLRNLAQVDGDQVRMQDPDSSLVETDPKKMSARFLISSIKKDSYGDTVMPQGCKDHLQRYTKNPVVFFGHKSSGFPIGSARHPETNQLVLDVADDIGVYSTVYCHGKTKESEDVFRLLEAKELRAASIGFMPILGEINKRKEEEDDKAPKNQVKFEPYYTFVFKQWELYEWSIVAVPANSDCIAMRLSKGFGGKRLSKGVEDYLSPFAAPLKIWANGFVPDNITGVTITGGGHVTVPVKLDGINDAPLEPAWVKELREAQATQAAILKHLVENSFHHVAAPPPIQVHAPVVEVSAVTLDHSDVLKQLLADVKKLSECADRNEKSLRRVTGKVD